MTTSDFTTTLLAGQTPKEVFPHSRNRYPPPKESSERRSPLDKREGEIWSF